MIPHAFVIYPYCARFCNFKWIAAWEQIRCSCCTYILYYFVFFTVSPFLVQLFCPIGANHFDPRWTIYTLHSDISRIYTWDSIMLRTFPSALVGEDPYSEFCRLAKDFRARHSSSNVQSTSSRSSSSRHDDDDDARTAPACSTLPVKESPSTAPWSTHESANAVSKSSTLIDDTDHTVHAGTSRVRVRRRQPKKRPPLRNAYSRSTVSHVYSSQKDKPSAASVDIDGYWDGGGEGSRGRSGTSDGVLDPNTEAAMMKAVNDMNGVSVSDIRRIYRKRHAEEKVRAMQEVRRWWRIKRSEQTTLAEVAIAAAELRARREGSRNLVAGFSPVYRSRRGDVPKNNNDLEADAATAIDSEESWQIRRAQTGDDHMCCIFDKLDWRQVLHDHSYTAGLVREIKRALRAGRPVKLRAREEHQPPGLQSSSADRQLMLKTLYIQCVRVSIDHNCVH